MKAPKEAQSYVDLIQEKEAWKLLNKPDGSFFRSFEEFCAHQPPWGWGLPYEKLRGYLAVALGDGDLDVGRRRLELVRTPDDGRVENGVNQGRDSHGRMLPVAPTVSGHHVPNQGDADERREKRHRAIKRAPAVVQAAYERGLIGQAEAAKLGPKDPEPEQAARIVEIARELGPLVDGAKNKPNAEKRRVQREVNARVRAALGTKTPTPLERVKANIAKLTQEDLCSLLFHVHRLLTERGVPCSVELGGSDAS